MKLFKKHGNQTTDYYVKANERHNLTFETRDDARQYKRLLAKSKSKIKGQIIKREFDGDYIRSETKVS